MGWLRAPARRADEHGLLEPQAEHSSPLVQYLNPIADRNSRGFQLADGGCDPAIGQVMTRVIVEPNDQYSGMMATGSHYQVMQVFEVLGIPSQKRKSLDDGEYKHSRIRDRQQPDVAGQDRIVPLSPVSGGETWTAQVLIDKESHSCVGPSRPRARSLAASWSRSCSISGRFWAT